MTLLLGTPLGLIIGIVLGSRRITYFAAAAAWYFLLAEQTGYLAEPGRTGFFGVNGVDALQGPVYWLGQPVILAVVLGATWVGIRLRTNIMRRTSGVGTPTRRRAAGATPQREEP